MKTYLVLNSSCFLWHNRSNGLMYDSAGNNLYMFECNKRINSACENLSDILNLYSIEINNKQLQDKKFENWLKKIIDLNMGQFLNKEDDQPKPISLPPLLVLEGNIYEPDKIKYESVNDILTYLHEVSIHIDDERDVLSLKTNKPADYSKNIENRLTVNDLANILIKIKNPELKSINLISKNILTRPDLNEIISLLLGLDINIYFLFTSSVILSESALLSKIEGKNISLQVICKPCDDLAKIERILVENKLDFQLIINVISEEEYEIVEEKIAVLESSDIEIKPVYDGKNLDFFEKYVFIAEEDIQECNLSKREVFANRALNTNFFGKLTIMPDGETYANINHPPIGNILKDSIYEILYKEMSEGTSWRMTRDSGQPCKDCLYRYLCPPPSNYELVIGKLNLCHINKS